MTKPSSVISIAASRQSSRFQERGYNKLASTETRRYYNQAITKKTLSNTFSPIISSPSPTLLQSSSPTPSTSLAHYNQSHPISYSSLQSRRSFGAYNWAQVNSAGASWQPSPKYLDPNAPPDPLKSPIIPDGHPVDTDGRPLGHVIPDYDVELPAFSFGGYANDFEAWTDPPVFPPTVWPKIAKYDYGELEIQTFPVVYEVDVLGALRVLAAMGITIAAVGTRWENNRYFAKNKEFYTSGWPHFHYEPSLDMVPLTARPDGMPPESLVIQFDSEDQLRHEMKEEDEE